MSGMTGASMLRTRRKDVNVKPNRKLDRKSSRGMLYENEELRLRTININAEVERGQSDIKKLKRENDQLKREISALRYEYDRLDEMLRERRSSPEHSDDSAGYGDCAECAAEGAPARTHVAFNELSVVPEEDAIEAAKTPPAPCTCGTCSNSRPSASHQSATSTQSDNQRSVDVLVHDAPLEPPLFFQSVTSASYLPPPPPGFVVTSPSFSVTSPSFSVPSPSFPTGGNVEDLLGEVQNSPTLHTFIQQNSVFMCNTRRVTQRQQNCCCRNNDEAKVEKQKCYITEKNIELNYDYPKITPPSKPEVQTTTEVASTVVFVERRMPVQPKKFDFFFRSRSAPVGDSDEPIYATVKKLPKRLKRMDLANLEREVAYPNSLEATKTEVAVKTDSDNQIPPDDDTSRSEDKQPHRPETPKVKKRRRFSLTFKKRERKRREDKNGPSKNGTAKNGLVVQSDNERLIEANETNDLAKLKACRHKPRNTVSSCSSGPRYKRDSYQEMTSHSEHERTSVSSSMNSMASACTHRSKISAPPQDSIPWCGCWGAGCV